MTIDDVAKVGAFCLAAWVAFRLAQIALEMIAGVAEVLLVMIRNAVIEVAQLVKDCWSDWRGN